METTNTTNRVYCHLHFTWDDKCAADIAVLSEYGHPEGPSFNGPRSVQCRNYDEHRFGFRRIRGQWHCADCHDGDYKHARSCDLA